MILVVIGVGDKAVIIVYGIQGTSSVVVIGSTIITVGADRRFGGKIKLQGGMHAILRFFIDQNSGPTNISPGPFFGFSRATSGNPWFLGSIAG
jgi:hypothetical protein